MDINAIADKIAQMFPKINLKGAINKANELMSGVPDNFEGVSGAASKLGINRAFVDDFYNKYGNTIQARAVCRMMGTTPEALKADAEKILGGAKVSYNAQSAPNNNSKSRKFPRLK